MSQNFLIEGWVPRDIAGVSGVGLDIDVLEIGPGIGPLTAQLARRAAKVTTIELDRTLYPILAETPAPYPSAEVVPGDVMKSDLTAPVFDKFSDLTATACVDLPCNITALVSTALIKAGYFASIMVMTQWEVAPCICAVPGSNDYRVPSVLYQCRTQPELLFEVGPECFPPALKVTSVVIRLIPRSVPPQNPVDDSLFFQVVRVSFVQRRKTLLNGLSSTFGSHLFKDAPWGVIEAAGLSVDIRDERPGTPKFAILASVLQNRF